MNSYDHENGYRQSILTSHHSKLAGAVALLLAILLSFMDIYVFSGLRQANGTSEMIVPIRVAALVTLGAVLSAIGAVAFFLNGLRQGRIVQDGGDEEQPPEPVVAEEIDVFNVRSKAA